MITIDNYLDNHYVHRSNWLRAAVLGANDGIISISSLAIGVAAASSTREPIVLATVAGLVAGALSMAAGEYVPVSSQTDIDALKAHIRDELDINVLSQANPLQAAFASGTSFTLGGILPLLVTLFSQVNGMEYWLYSFTIISLILLGIISAKTGGSSIKKAIIRITIWGTLAMGLSALVGYLFGVKI